MVVCSILYFFTKNIFKQNEYRHYRINGIIIEITLLAGFYLAGNYFAISEMSNQFFHSLKENETISLGWLFWVFTVTIPLVYIWWGVKKKDIVLIRVGLILIAVMVFTIRFYHAVLRLETAMVLGGIFLLLFLMHLQNTWQHQKMNLLQQKYLNILLKVD